MTMSQIPASAALVPAAQRAQELLREVTGELHRSPVVPPELILDHRAINSEACGDSRQYEDHYTLLSGDRVTDSKTLSRDGRVLKHSIERYHEGLTEADERADLVEMSTRHIPRVVSLMCGWLGAFGINLQPRDSVAYMHQTDRWDGVRLSSHRNTERIRVYADGVKYERRDDNGSVKLFFPGLALET